MPTKPNSQRRSASRAARQQSSSFKVAERGLAAVGAIVSITALWHGSYIATLWFLVAVVAGLTILHWGLSKPSFLITIPALIAGIVIQHFFLTPLNAPFSIEIETAFEANSRNDSPMFAEYGGHYFSPIPIMLFIRIVNLQSIPSDISELKLQVASRNSWWGLRKDWTDLPLLPVLSGDMPVLWLQSPSSWFNVTFDDPLLVKRLQDRPLGPHETVQGWALFDAPADFDSSPRPLTLRITLKDTAGAAYRMVTASTSPGGNIPLGHGIRLSHTATPNDVIIRHFFYSAPN